MFITEDIKYIQPKLDGIRCNIHYDNNEVFALSRKNNPFYTVEHIKESLLKITSAMGVESKIEVKERNDILNIVLYSESNNILIGKNGRKLKEIATEIPLDRIAEKYGFYDSNYCTGGDCVE